MSRREVVLDILENEIFYPDVAGIIISFLDINCKLCKNKMLYGEGYKTIWDFKMCRNCMLRKQFEKCKICGRYSPVVLTDDCLCVFLCKECKPVSFLL